MVIDVSEVYRSDIKVVESTYTFTFTSKNWNLGISFEDTISNIVDSTG
jgi:hypothetical protein